MNTEIIDILVLRTIEPSDRHIIIIVIIIIIRNLVKPGEMRRPLALAIHMVQNA